MPDCIQENRPPRLALGRLVRFGLALTLALSVMQLCLNVLSRFGLSLYPLLVVTGLAALLRFGHGALAGSRYTLMPDRILVEKLLGDSVTFSREIALERVLSLRDYVPCEDLGLFYRPVTRIGPGTGLGLGLRLSFLCAPLNTSLARRLAAGKTGSCGKLLVYENGQNRGCVAFVPDERFLSALRTALGELPDDRYSRPQAAFMRAMALEKAFPFQYPHAKPLIAKEDLLWAEEEKKARAERRAERQRKRLERKLQMETKPAPRKKRKPAAAGKKKKPQEAATPEKEPAGPEMAWPENSREIVRDPDLAPEVISVRRAKGAAKGSRDEEKAEKPQERPLPGKKREGDRPGGTSNA